MAASGIAITRNKTQQATKRAPTHPDTSDRESEHNNDGESHQDEDDTRLF